MLTTFYPPYNFGGDGIGVQRLSRALARRGHDVTVVHDTDAFNALTRNSKVEAPLRDSDEGVTVVRLASRAGTLSPLLVQQLGRPVLHARQLRALLAPGAFDVVTFNNISLIGGPGLLHYPTDAVSLYMAHEHWLICPTHVLWRFRKERCDERHCLRCVLSYHRPPQLWRYTGALRRGIAKVDTVVAMSEFSRRKHQEFGLQRSMEVLPYFLPDATGADITPPPPRDRPYCFFAGRLELIKGLDDVIPVFAGLPEMDLIIAGDGDHAARLRELAAGIPNVHFLGRLPPEELSAYYRHAVATLVPSLCYETFGIVIIEAFRQGTPVVARRVGPFPELIERSGAGALFDDSSELAAILRGLLADTGKRDRLAANGIAAVKAHWTESVVVPGYLDIIRRAGATRGHARINAFFAHEGAT